MHAQNVQYPGLKILTQKKEEEKRNHGGGGKPAEIIHSYNMVHSLSPPPPSSTSSSPPLSTCSSCSIVLDSSSSSSMGDLIGTESGVYTISSNEEEILMKPIIERRRRSSGSFNGRYCDTVKKEYPPPIPSLARTGNLPGRMPWVFTRRYSDDGRLIISEMRVERHEFFHAHRENGRLILKLIPMGNQQEYDDDDDDGDDDELELEDLEVDNLQFVEQDGGKEKMVSEEEEREIEDGDGNDDDDDDEDGIEIRKTVVGKFPKFSTCSSGMFMDSKQCLCNGVDDQVHEGPHTYLGMSSSSSSSVPLRRLMVVAAV